MESNYLTSRTYTTPTCSLIVAPPQLSIPTREQQDLQLPDFSLQLADIDRGEHQVIVEGGRHQLDFLHKMVNEYITDLVAKFPSLIENAQSDQVQVESEADQSISPQVIQPSQFTEDRQLDPRSDEHLQRSGIIKNLPGLRADLTRSISQTDANDLNLSPKSPISKLFGRWSKPGNLQKSPLDILAGTSLHDKITDRSGSASPAAISSGNKNLDSVPTTPYISRVSDRPLDHQLHLSNLATEASGKTITLSAIGLFDLANVLDEYAAEKVAATNQPQTATSLSQSALPNQRNQTKELDPPATPLSQFPNLPRSSTKPANTQVYYQTKTRRSRSYFVSGIPWAIAAALGVGIPSLLLDSRDNFLKDAVSKLNIPGLTTAQKSVVDTLSNKPVKSGSNSQSPDPAKTDSPTPWQSQPVVPPTVKTQAPGKTPQDPRKIGIATLPTAIATSSGQQLPNPTATTKPTAKPTPTIAPKPLESTPVPADLNAIGNSTGVRPTATTTPAPSKVPTKPTGVKPTITPKATPPQIGQLPISRTDPNPTGKVSVSKQQVLVPPSDLPPLINNSQIPFSPIGGDTNGQPTSGTPKPQNPKKTTTPKVKPTTAPNSSATKPAQPTVTATNSSAPIEPFTPIPKNPNLIDPNQTNPQGVESPTPASVPTKPLQSNNPGNNAGTEATDGSSLQETKRYFQSKWKPNKSQPTALQYMIQVNGKNGTVRSITPQGEAATTYLQQSKLIKPGQKLVSPTAAGNNDQKIWVLLQPDGSVETSAE
jgi:Domain of unknown function (DUF4335)